MKKFNVEDLKEGMVFNKPIYYDKNNLFIEQNSPVTKDNIRQLMKWGISFVETDGTLVKRANNSEEEVVVEVSTNAKKILDNYNNLMSQRQKLLEVNQAAHKVVSKVYSDIRNSEKFTLDELDDVISDIIKLLMENRNVFLFLYGLDEGKDYLITHSVNVTFYALMIGIALKYPKNQLKKLGIGTLLIDAGMTKISSYIIHKKSNLSEQEYQQIKTHPIHGYKALIEQGDVDKSIANISLMHHEQFDGKGYPRNLSGNDIHEFARIVTIADSYEAQISSRSYKNKIDFYHAMRNLLSSGVNKFDPVILRVFLSIMSVYPIGSIVKINDESIGIIIGSIPEKPLRPIVKLIRDKDGKEIEETQILNLLSETSYYILKALNEDETDINIFDVL